MHFIFGLLLLNPHELRLDRKKMLARCPFIQLHNDILLERCNNLQTYDQCTKYNF